jgi:(p)ppGpp synthase/HD superfamily hydrolase
MLTEKFQLAIDYAFELHKHQTRKGTSIPYLSHLMSVAALVIENGGDEEQAIAALLHDAVEDQGGERTLAEIRLKFGERVANIVDGCTDAYIVPKPPWKQRKEAYLQHLAVETPEVLLVSLADKVHNARSILADLNQYGAPVWKRFNGGKSGTLWYYRSLANIFASRCDSELADELQRVVNALEKISV